MKVSAVKIMIITVLLLASSAAHAGIPVIDSSNLSQNVVTALQSVAMTMKQIDQYRIQLQQYQNMLQNTAAPGTNTWDQAQTTMRQLHQFVGILQEPARQHRQLPRQVSRYVHLYEFAVLHAGRLHVGAMDLNGRFPHTGQPIAEESHRCPVPGAGHAAKKHGE